MKTYVEINNTPSDSDKYIVARHDKDTRSFWFWGSYEDKETAENVARQINGFVAEVADENDNLYLR